MTVTRVSLLLGLEEEFHRMGAFHMNLHLMEILRALSVKESKEFWTLITIPSAQVRMSFKNANFLRSVSPYRSLTDLQLKFHF